MKINVHKRARECRAHHMDLCVWAGLQWVVTTLRFVLGSERKNNLEVHRINLAQMHQIINKDSVIAPSPSLTVSLPSMTSLPQSLLLFIYLYYYSIPKRRDGDPTSLEVTKGKSGSRSPRCQVQKNGFPSSSKPFS